MAMELSIIQYLDPNCLNFTTIKQNFTQLKNIKRKLMSTLTKQNQIQTSNISLELEHLLDNTDHRFESLINVYEKYKIEKNIQAYFQELLLTENQKPELYCDIQFYGTDVISIHMSLINDIEIFLKRLNSVFYCVSTEQGLKCIKAIAAFLKQIRGISPIPEIYLYSQNIPCLKCLNETMILPNQGDSYNDIINNITCDHIASCVQGEPVTGLFENELKQKGLSEYVYTVPEQVSADTNKTKVDNLYNNDSKNVLKEYNVFKYVPETIVELSNLLYWDSLKDITGPLKPTCSKLAKMLTREAILNETKKTIDTAKHKTMLVHFFDEHVPTPIEKLFCGSIFSGIEDIIDALKNDCSSVFITQKQYAYVSLNRDEIYSKLTERMRLLNSLPTSDKKSSISVNVLDPKIVTQSNVSKTDNDILHDACHRKEAYLKQLADDGLSKLHSCIQKQGETLYRMLNMRVWGDLIYSHLSAFQNHFLFRKAIYNNSEWTDNTQPTHEMFENSKYMRSSLFSQTLSNEHLHDLTMEFYKLINGPLSYNNGIFPQPENITLAKTFQAAGILPHQKIKVTSMFWPNIKPKDWIETGFNNFYNVEQLCLQSIQENIWSYIRELVLSISLYNNIFGKQLQIFNTVNHSTVTGLFKDGVYITYETSRPLLLINKSRGWIFKDLYALLYTHLQCTRSVHDDNA